jgi:hypothetical protein
MEVPEGRHFLEAGAMRPFLGAATPPGGFAEDALPDEGQWIAWT